MCARPTCDDFNFIPGQCCPVCNPVSCVVKSTTYKDGENVPDADPCKFCRCNDGEVICGITDCAPSTCKNITFIPGQCCPVCSPVSCVVKSTTYKDGENVPDADPCKFCRCHGGEVICSISMCARPTCDDFNFIPGQCCPVCNPVSCVVKSTTYKDGENVPDADPCKFCRCNDGEVMCAITDCARPKCKDVIPIPGRCCPVCSTAARGCAPGWVRFKASCYKIDAQTKAKWTDAKRACEAEKSHLAIIMSAKENLFVKNELRKINITDENMRLWMDGNNMATEGRWIWERTGALIRFSDWGQGEPDQHGGEEECLSYYRKKNFQWSDEKCDRPFGYVCEKRITRGKVVE